MYGSRSANGVILITTKGGQEGAPRIDVKYLHTWGKLSHKLAQATRADRRKFDILRDTYHKDNATGYVDNASNQLINDSLNARSTSTTTTKTCSSSGPRKTRWT